MKKLKKETLFLFLILLSAGALRIWNVGNQDPIGDEGTEAFRSIGYLDYLGTNFQTQPVDWHKDSSLPLWTSLSFHDHPPLSFFLRHLLFKVTGDSIFAARLPAAIAGIMTAYLIYLFIKKYWKNIEEKSRGQAALIGAAVTSLTLGSVLIFRTTLIEPLLLFFIVWNVYAFFSFLEKKSRWWLFGLTLGLVLLTKYTALFLLPTYLVFIAIWRRDLFKDWRLYLAFFLTLTLLAPVIIYNAFLYAERGHFDLQISYALGQDVPEWSGLLGKAQDPFSAIGPNLIKTFGYPMLILGMMGFSYFLYQFPKRRSPEIGFVFLYIIFLFLLLTQIGSASRFLVLGMPMLAVVIGVGLYNLLVVRKISTPVKIGCLILIILLEGFVVVKNIFLDYPDYGIAKLDHYFEAEFRGKTSGVTPQADNPHLSEVIKKYSKDDNPENTFLAMIIYNDNVAAPTLAWIFDRRFFYHSIPVLYIENFISLTKATPPEFFKGFTLYFVQSTEYTSLNPFKKEKTIGAEFEKSLVEKNLKPINIIYGQNNLPMFRIYKFTI